MKILFPLKIKIIPMLFLILSIVCATVHAGATPIAEQQNNLAATSFDVEDDGLHTTACILVKDGVSYTLTREEYMDLKNTSDFVSTVIPELPENTAIPTPRFSFFYTFTPKGNPVYAYYDSLAGRICPVYGNADKIVLKQTMTYTRTFTESGSINMTAAVKDVIDASISSSYSLSASATSSISKEIAGEFRPSGNYKYVSVVFTPRLATVNGDLKWWQRFENEDSVLTTTPCTAIYPAGSNGLLDGIYERVESNNRNSFPEMV